jgi:DNA-binding NtrC family response regulator
MPVPQIPARRLLLVEDDQMVRETITLMLEDEYEIIHAVSAATALTELGSLGAPSVNVVLLDCLLPKGNVPHILAAADARSVPVVLISGDPNQAQAVDASRPFLQKPFTRATLLSALDSARR